MTKNEERQKIVDLLQMKLQELPLQPHGILYKDAAEYLADALIAGKMTAKTQYSIPKGNYCDDCKYIFTQTFPLFDENRKIIKNDYFEESKCALYDQHIVSVHVLYINEGKEKRTFGKCTRCKLESEKEFREENNDD